MTAGETHAQGSVDREGRLIDADERILALQIGAGGQMGGILAIPQFASLARIARTLGVPVSRNMVVAEGPNDLELTLRGQLAGDIVKISMIPRAIRNPVRDDAATLLKRSQDFARLESEGEWECDAELRLTSIDEGLRILSGTPADAALGFPATRLFKLHEDVLGDFPFITAFASRASFAEQIVELRGFPHALLSLHGEPVFDSTSAFRGFKGGYGLRDQVALAKVRGGGSLNAGVSGDFSKRLDAALRRPITSIIAKADEISLRAEGPLRQDYAGYAHDISAAGRHLLGLVDHLADVNAVEAETFQVESEGIDLVDVARRAAGLLAIRAGDKGVRIDVPPPDETLDAFGDFGRVLQIMVNLLSNAVRYAPHNSGVWVRTEREGDLAAIIVADQGKGIAPQDMERIFDKFERVDPTEPGGNGLGLYISRRLARAMGGDITVDSAPGQGARFMLTLPAPLPEPEEAPSS